MGNCKSALQRFSLRNLAAGSAMLMLATACTSPLSAISGAAQGSSATKAGGGTGAQSAAKSAFGRLAAGGFEQNQGQSAPQVRFMSKGHGYRLFLTPDSAVMTLNSQVHPAPGAAPKPSVAIKMTLESALKNPAVKASGRRPGMANYLRPSNDVKGVKSFGKVTYRGVYRGIDMTFHGTGSSLEYDFLVAPGANPNQIKMNFAGADKVSIDSQGRLVIATPAGNIVEPKPTVFQQINGSKKKVSAHYVMTGVNQAGFSLGTFDHSRPLVIDPIVYVAKLGGSGGPGFADDSAQAVAVDSSGSAYIAGFSPSAAFPTTTGAYQTAAGGDYDAFVAKINPAGNALVYSTYLGGSGAEFANGLALDSSNNAYISGFTSSTNFPTTTGVYSTSNGGGDDAFVAKLNSMGTGLVYSTYLGGAGDDEANAIALDSSNNAIVTGRTVSSNFPTSAGSAYDSTANGGADAFVSKINSTGTTLSYSTYLGGADDDFGAAVAVHADKAYVTGQTISSAFPTTTGVLDTGCGTDTPATCNGGPSAFSPDAFVAQVDPGASGAASLVYSTYLGGGDSDQGGGIAVDSGGAAYVVGSTGSTDFPTVGAFQTVKSVGLDAFVAKLNSTATSISYSTFLGGNDTEFGNAIALDSTGKVYVAGVSSSVMSASNDGLPTKDPSMIPDLGISLTDGNGSFVAKFNPALTGAGSLIYSSYLGGFGAGGLFSIPVRIVGGTIGHPNLGYQGLDFAHGIALGPSNSVFVAGETSSLFFTSPSIAAFSVTSACEPECSQDAFVAKLTMP